jgi:hypothetical protein
MKSNKIKALSFSGVKRLDIDLEKVGINSRLKKKITDMKNL